jgi:hypothetical protein
MSLVFITISFGDCRRSSGAVLSGNRHAEKFGDHVRWLSTLMTNCDLGNAGKRC